MSELNDRLRTDASFADAFARAQADYIERRNAVHDLGEAAGGVGGGPLDRIKCLHSHYAHHLVSGCNPVGESVEEQVGPLLHAPPCVRTD